MPREMKDSGIEWVGDIPSHWHLIKNKNAFLCKKEIVGEKSSETQLLSLTTRGVRTKSPTAIGGKVPESFDTYQYVEKDDLIMCLFDLDCSAVFSGISPCNGMISPAYKILKCKSSIIPSFASYWFSFVFIDRKFKPYAKNLRYTLTYDEFATLSILVPTLSEQQAISDFLDKKCAEIDAVIEQTKETIEQYKALKRALITDTVTKGVRCNRLMKDSENIWYGEIPACWNVSKLKYVFTIKKDIAGKEGYTVLSITQKGVVPKNISSNEGQLAENYSNYQLVSIGDFAMNHMDLLTGWVDISKYEGVTSPDYRVFVLNDSVHNCKRYYLYLMQMCYNNRIFYGLGQGVSGMGRWRLQADKFLNFTIPIPPTEEQEEIANFLDDKCSEIDALIEKKTALLEEMENLKKSIIFEYVTGKKEVAI